MVFGAVLAAQNAPWTDLQNQLWAKLSTAFPRPSTPGTLPEVLILANPGLSLDSLGVTDGSGLAQLLDALPTPGRDYVPSGFSCSKVYHTVIFGSELPLGWDAKAQARARAASHLLHAPGSQFKPSETMNDYLKYKKAYDDAAAALNGPPDRTEVRSLQYFMKLQGRKDAAAQALQDWETLGHRAQVEQALADLDALQNQHVYHLFSQLQDDLEQYGVEEGDPNGYPTEVHPAAGTWTSDAGWVPFSFKGNSFTWDLPSTAVLDQLLKNGSPAVRPPPPPKFTANLTLASDLKRVYVARPWLDLGVFHSTQWRLGPAVGYTKVSTGNLADADPGAMPLVVSGLLLGRHLVLNGGWDEQDAPFWRNLEAFGPWALRGSTKGGASNLRATVTQEAGTITVTVDAPQIIGFFCEVIPKSPTPDPLAFPEP